jgi:ATP-dependent DNA helicase DinG
MKARQKAQRADVLIINHHLFCADLALKEDAIGDFLPRADIFIFDEAHQLPDIATDFFGESVSTRQLIDLSRDSLRAGLADAPGAADWRRLASSLETAARRLRLALPEQTVRLGADQLLALAPGPDGSLREAVQSLISALGDTARTLESQQERSLDLARCALRAEEIGLRAADWSAQLEAASQPPDRAAPASIIWAQTTSHHAALRSTPCRSRDAWRSSVRHWVEAGSSCPLPLPSAARCSTLPVPSACRMRIRRSSRAPSIIRARRRSGWRTRWDRWRRPTFQAGWRGGSGH